jgi:hypothetical protein
MLIFPFYSIAIPRELWCFGAHEICKNKPTAPVCDESYFDLWWQLRKKVKFG